MRAPIDNFTIRKHPKGSVTQWFGENPDLYGRWGLAGHNGIDIVGPHGTSLYIVEDCIVLEVNNNPNGYGKHVRLLSLDKDEDGYSREWTYGHCDTISVQQGDVVEGGDQIATMGNTGFVVSGNTPYWSSNPYTGTHLHIGVRLVKRLARGGWSYPGSSIRLEVLNYDNGYKGSIDPYPYLAGLSQVERRYRNQQLTAISLLNTFLKLLKLKQ